MPHYQSQELQEMFGHLSYEMLVRTKYEKSQETAVLEEEKQFLTRAIEAALVGRDKTEDIVQGLRVKMDLRTRQTLDKEMLFHNGVSSEVIAASYKTTSYNVVDIRPVKEGYGSE